MLGKSEGIILRTVDYGEGNKILTVFTKELGKIGIMAQGARKMKSRFSALSQPFIYAQFLFHTSSGLSTLSQGEIIYSFPKIRADLYKTAYATYLLECTERIVEEHKRNPAFFDLLFHVLQHLENGKDYEIVARIFEVKMLGLSGHKPVLDHCVLCGKGNEPWFFSSREGGLLCQNCRVRDPFAILLSSGTSKLLHLFQIMNIAQLGEINVKESTKLQLQKVLKLFIDEHLGLRLKSSHFLDQLEKIEKIIPRKGQDHGESANN